MSIRVKSFLTNTLRWYDNENCPDARTACVWAYADEKNDYETSGYLNKYGHLAKPATDEGWWCGSCLAYTAEELDMGKRSAIGADIPQRTMGELLSHLGLGIHDKVITIAKESVAVVYFENMMMDSSHCGERSVLAVGPGKTYKTVAELRGKNLGETPSVFQYPLFYAVLKKG